MGFRDITVDFEMKEKIKIVIFDGDETIFPVENGNIYN